VKNLKSLTNRLFCVIKRKYNDTGKFNARTSANGQKSAVARVEPYGVPNFAKYNKK
jgi:hypothetical protein